MAENHTTAPNVTVPYSTGESKISDTTIAGMRELANQVPTPPGERP